VNRSLLILLDKTVFQVIFYFILLLTTLFKKNIPNYRLKPDQSTSFLVIRPGGLGDGLMSIPILKALRKNFPANQITLMCVKKNQAIFQQLSFLDEVMVIDKLSDFSSNLYKLFWGKYNCVFDFEPFRKISSILAFLSGSEVRIGFDTNVRRKLYTHFVVYHNEKSYESINMLRQLTVFGIGATRNEALDISFDLPETIKRRANDLLQSNGVEPEKDIIIAVAPGVLKPQHRWVMSRFAELIEMIRSEDLNTKILLVGAPSDVSDAKIVLQYLSGNERVINFVGKTTFSEVLGLLSASKILIACDGGMVYMAASMGCDTISLWGPGVMERFKPPGGNHIGIRKDYGCIPCVNYSRLGEFPPCPYNRRCLNDITAREVFDQHLRLKSKVHIAHKEAENPIY